MPVPCVRQEMIHLFGVECPRSPFPNTDEDSAHLAFFTFAHSWAVPALARRWVRNCPSSGRPLWSAPCRRPAGALAIMLGGMLWHRCPLLSSSSGHGIRRMLSGSVLHCDACRLSCNCAFTVATSLQGPGGPLSMTGRGACALCARQPLTTLVCHVHGCR